MESIWTNTSHFRNQTMSMSLLIINCSTSGIYELIEKKLTKEGYTWDLYLNLFVGYIDDRIPQIAGGDKSVQRYGSNIKSKLLCFL